MVVPFPCAAPTVGALSDAAAGHHGNALRVSLSVPMDYVIPLGKGTTIACEACLAMNTDKLTEPDNIVWTEY